MANFKTPNITTSTCTPSLLVEVAKLHWKISPQPYAKYTANQFPQPLSNVYNMWNSHIVANCVAAVPKFTCSTKINTVFSAENINLWKQHLFSHAATHHIVTLDIQYVTCLHTKSLNTHDGQRWWYNHNIVYKQSSRHLSHNSETNQPGLYTFSTLQWHIVSLKCISPVIGSSWSFYLASNAMENL
jgi:hypothetical protein